MSRFIQFHILTSYPASNLNRDDLGRPKTVLMGDALRLRVSSQSLKRAWRTSDCFEELETGSLTNSILVKMYTRLVDEYNLPEDKAFDAAKALTYIYGGPKSTQKKKTMDQIRTGAMVFLSNSEQKNLYEFVEKIVSDKKLFKEVTAINKLKDKDAKRKKINQLAEGFVFFDIEHIPADVALFGRMLASSNRHNIEAAAQVAHAMTVHKAAVEDDFFTAVDDLNRDDAGAGHLGVTEFGAGLFYLYLCVDRELLKENLGGDADLANRAVAALVNAACTVSPSGKQNSFGSRAWASYCLAEKGDIQPCNLSVAYLKPLGASDRYDEKKDSVTVEDAVKRLEQQRSRFNEIYNVETESSSFGPAGGTLADVLDFIRE
ncbi:type I-E CRISPR-associated protein Cas7/Cse4/CasC [Maridesulfovibrio sp.]|uniref:type I-E CRISPR-associated protein Cas7/Cse4/CasC n=1 Tax=Maridesulfovibrio sp. TaxID=2795000 RepID=UPI0029CA92C6|nr:type I-E CRISPR-associated protein Cas7/Cse4/CasC [Maridesulfovibrio sp.]